MVCDQSDGDILFMLFAVGHACDRAHLVAQRLDRIHVKNGIHILNYNGKTLQTHSGIDVLLLQLGVMTFTVVVELGKYVVPYLDVAVAVAANGTSRFSAAVLLAAVVINLRTRTAGTCAMLPEIVFFSETEDSLRRDSDLFFQISNASSSSS